MDRRQLFKALIGGGAVAAVPAVARPATIDIEKRHWIQDRSGHWWLMHWTSWKPMSSASEMVCQFIAYPVIATSSNVVDLTRPSLYSSFPGACHWFMRGDCFDLAYRAEQAAVVPGWVNSASPEGDLRRAEMWSYRRLRGYMEKVARLSWDQHPYLITGYKFEWDKMIEEA